MSGPTEQIDQWLKNAEKGVAEGKPQFVLRSAAEFRKLNRIDLAIQVLKDGHQAFSESPEMFRDLATCLVRRDPEEAIRFADSNLARFGPVARYQKAVALDALGRKFEAISELEETIEEYPQQVEDRYVVSKLWDLYNENNQSEKALRFLEPLIDKNTFTDRRMRQLCATSLNKLGLRQNKVLSLLADFDDPESARLKQWAREITGDVAVATRPVPNISAAAGKGQTGLASQVPIKIFISHSSIDTDIAGALVELFRAAILLPAESIRCTTVPGYRLPGGVSTDDHLRREIDESVTFIAIITQASLVSSYVLFELGARWGARKHLLPLLAKGIKPSQLRAPLNAVNALDCDDEAQLFQCVTEIAKILDQSPQNTASFQQYVRKVSALSQTPAP